MSPTQETELYSRFSSALKQLAADLKHLGYAFNAPPGPAIDTQIERNRFYEYIRKIGVNVPHQIRNFMGHVGHVDLRGRWPHHHEILNRTYSDPFVFLGVRALLAGLSEFDYSDPRERAWTIAKYGSLHFPFSPDYYSKADESGGMPYCIELNGEPDPRVLFTRHMVRFSEYLALVCEFCGFPGLAFDQAARASVAALVPASTQETLAEVADDLRDLRGSSPV